MKLGNYSVHDAIYCERSALDVNLNKMKTTDSIEELQDMFGFAIMRVVNLRNLNMQRLAFKELCGNED